MNTIPHPPIPRFRPGSIVTERWRITAPPGPHPQKRVHLVVAQSRAPGKVRVRSWSHQPRRWCSIRTEMENLLVEAPVEWACTQSAMAAVPEGLR